MKYFIALNIWLSCFLPVLLYAQLTTEGHKRSWGIRSGATTAAPVTPAPPPVVMPQEIPVYQPVIGPSAPIVDLHQQPQTPVIVEKSEVIPYDASLPHEFNVIQNITAFSDWQNMPTRTSAQVVLMAKEALRDARVQAFLDIIARAEVADQFRRDDAYKILHGFGMLREYTRLHPGVKSKGATAAGRYQFTQRTYNRIYHNYPTANLSFHPPGQDLATVLLLHDSGILRFIAQDDIVGGVKHGAKTWAGLPYYEDGDHTGNKSYYRGVHKNRATFGFEVAEQHYLNRLAIYRGGVGNVYIPPNVQMPTVTNVPTAPTAPIAETVVNPPIITPPVVVPLPNTTPPPTPIPTEVRRGSWRVNG